FCLFFFNNPKNPKKPRQLMILWSIKNVKEIYCNYLKIRADNSRDRSKLDGVVATWYFDGDKMHHNFLLERCNLYVSDKKLSTDSIPSSSFSINKAENTVRIGDNFKFIAEAEGNNLFTRPTYNSDIYFANKGYSVIRTNYLRLGGEVQDKPIQGSAYFQRVFVNGPSVPWYWGIFHFESGAVLSYFNPYLFGKSFKRDVAFFDGSRVYSLGNMKIKKSGKVTPTFTVSAENKDEKIDFTVNAYSHSSWTFKGKPLGFIPTKLVYNEYPAVISDFIFKNKKTGEKITSEDLGKSMGNAEHTTGVLF
ncbi:MAG: hypothetical protein ACE5J5_01965, partial [Candidatus Hydrothermarchaeales archaeon]